MPPRRRNTTPANPDQLGLNLRGEGFEGPLEARGVFSKAYLSRHLRSAPEFASESDTAQVSREIAEIWRARVTALGRQNEAFNCSTFLEPVLDRLGWLRIPQQSMPNDFTTRKRPDYCLFTSETEFTSASEADANTLFRLSATVVEAKKYGHPLDQLSSSETPGWFPSQQIQDYLNHAKDANGRRYFNWAILTNCDAARRHSRDRRASGPARVRPWNAPRGAARRAPAGTPARATGEMGRGAAASIPRFPRRRDRKAASPAPATSRPRKRRAFLRRTSPGRDCPRCAVFCTASSKVVL